MKCPFCNHLENRVIDSRLSREGDITRRRRECVQCDKRYTTYERIEEILPMVAKKDGRREPFDRLKISAGIQRACEKRPISVEKVEHLISDIERYFQDKGEKEISSGWILLSLSSHFIKNEGTSTVTWPAKIHSR